MDKLVFSFQHAFVRKTKFAPGRTPEFDFIVVGGGPAGCALAARLAEAEVGSVVLIEQGTTVDQHPELRNCVQHPLQTRVLHGSSFDAHYRAATEGNYGRKELVINSGNVLGGSSCINWAIWTRGSRDDFDLWADMVGDDAFNWENMLPYFKRIDRSSGGPISIRKVSSTARNPWSSSAEASLQQSGFKKVESLEDGDLLGYGVMTETVDGEGKRSEAGEYLRAAQKSSGEEGKGILEVWTALRVEKIVVGQGEGDRATGVMTPLGMIRAKKEVILTAGAIQSPHLLLRSGIGPAAHLKQHGVPVVCDSPHVGQHLWEHPYVDLMFKLKDDKRKDTVEDFASIKTLGRHVDSWAKSKSGLMSGLPYEWIGYTNLKDRIEEQLRDDASLATTDRLVLMRTTTPHIEQMVFYGHGLTPAPDPLVSSYIAISNVLLTPRSRGSISLTSSNDPSTPHIIVNQLNEKIDREMMLAAIEKSYQILNTPAWAEHLELEEMPTRQQLLELIKDRVSTLWHFGGTCAMETKYMPGVVDSEFRVRGVRGLRVADTSVIPIPITAHTQSTAYVLGEKAAAFIKREYIAIL